METTPHDKAARLASEAHAAFSAHRFLDAISALNGALYLLPRNASLYALRAEAYVQLCDLQSAIANLRKAHRLSIDAEDAARRAQGGTQDTWDAPADQLLEKAMGFSGNRSRSKKRKR